MKFNIEKKLDNCMARAGVIDTPHGQIETPAFAVVGTKATIKALTSEQVKSLGAQVVLGNTYHLYLEPGDELVKKAGGFSKFMNWEGPTMTDSGGFQAFSLGAAFGKKVSKISSRGARRGLIPLRESIVLTGDLHGELETDAEPIAKFANINEGGVTFKSVIDGSTHQFTPERSMEIQWNLGADIIFAFDECTSPDANYEYQKEAMGRTHRWAARSLAKHCELKVKNKNLEGQLSNVNCQMLFGIVQGGRFRDLREDSAKFIASLPFDGFGIGGSFDKEDMYTVVNWVNKILSEEKPRHLLGIGEPADLFGGVENGCDLFDCVAPTRMARNGTLYTKNGRINITNAKYRDDFTPIEKDCGCYTCGQGLEIKDQGYSRAYLAHLFRANEMLASTLASIHNLYFIVNLVKKIRQSILDDKFFEFKKEFLGKYGK
jgi:queuine tRNA-ribosyltransferase